MRTSFHTGFLSGLDVRDAVRLVVDHGYDEVELNAETLPWAAPHVTPETPADVRRELASLATYSAISAHHADFAHSDQSARAQALAWTEGLLDLAIELDCPVVHVIPGDHAEASVLVDSLRRTVDAARARGLRLALEPIVNQIIGTSEQAEQVLAAVPGLDINFDPSHLQVMEGDVTAAAHRLAPNVVHMALKDASGTPDDWCFDALGDGEIDFAALLAALAGHGFDGVVSVEHESHAFAGDTRDHHQVLTESKAFLDDLLASTVGHDRTTTTS